MVASPAKGAGAIPLLFLGMVGLMVIGRRKGTPTLADPDAGIPPSANYGPYNPQTPERQCQTCEHYRTGWTGTGCALWKAPILPTNVCDSWMKDTAG